MKKRIQMYWLIAIIPAIILLFIPSSVMADRRTDDAITMVDYLDTVPPIIMKEPLLGLLGQTEQPIPYTFKETVKISGHACGAVTGAWLITRKALEALYPSTLPVRGQIKVIMPGAEDEWLIGVFGQVIANITGAAPKTGFPGGALGPAFNRRNLMVYAKEPVGTPPTKMRWIFERTDTGAKVAIRYDLSMIQPSATPASKEVEAKVARGLADAQELKNWQANWNAGVKFLFDNADTLPGLFTVEKLR
ncbi:MAG: hypothetical protein KJ804_21525 [Proteobacteria bacterium]|nr:hypothetical protein [Pseudomonadota bacterium]MBU1060892.1 hypothetical protein [Pseudomonadota bacterium]